MPKFISTDFNFRDCDIERIIRSKVKEEMDEVGHQAVEYARENGQYHDVTGHLRASNRYEIVGNAEALRIENTASYASDMEARGKEVITGAALFAESELKRRFSK